MWILILHEFIVLPSLTLFLPHRVAMVALLVIDDDHLILSLYRKILNRYGYRVHTADSGEEGIRMFENEEYALVITDLVMGEMDGNGVADYIRCSERGETPIIGISGTPWKAHAPYFDAVMAKPVPMKELVDRVRTLVEAHGKRVVHEMEEAMHTP